MVTHNQAFTTICGGPLGPEERDYRGATLIRERLRIEKTKRK